jgi:hypothetical protein
MSKINKSRFCAPRWHQQRPMKIPTIEKTHWVSIYLTTKYAWHCSCKKGNSWELPLMFCPPLKRWFGFLEDHIKGPKTIKLTMNINSHVAYGKMLVVYILHVE